MHAAHRLVALSFVASLGSIGSMACGGGHVSTVAPSSSSPSLSRAVGPAAEEAMRREYTLDVTHEERQKFKPGEPEPPRITYLYRVSVIFEVPKIDPDDAREPHAVNRAMWEGRKAMATCFYEGPGKKPGEEFALVGWLDVKKNGDIGDAGVESPAGGEAWAKCVADVAKEIKLSNGASSARVRFRLKLRTIDVTGSTPKE